jgi:cation transport ATPase
MKEIEFLRLVASLEVDSEHPIARAIVEGAEERGIQLRSRRRASWRWPVTAPERGWRGGRCWPATTA